MKTLRKNLGITLVALVVTIVILLILVGITLQIINTQILKKTIEAVNINYESTLKEKIEFAWTQCDMAYNENSNNMSKEEYFKANLISELQKLDEFKNVEVTIDLLSNSSINLEYKDIEYEFEVTAEGIIYNKSLLREKVKIGDYVEYPVEYVDVYSKIQYNALNGWRVIDNGKLNENSKSVRLISTGFAAKWYYDDEAYNSSQEAVEYIENNFESTKFINHLAKKFNGSYFKVNNISKHITIMSLTDLNNASSRNSDDLSNISENDEMFYTNNPSVFCWLLTPDKNNNKKLYSINNNTITGDSGVKMGVRIIITLDENQSGTLEDGVWKLN